MEKLCLIYALPVILILEGEFKKRHFLLRNYLNTKLCFYKNNSTYKMQKKYFAFLFLIPSPGGCFYDLPISKLNNFSLKEFSSKAFIPANFKF